MDTRVYTIDIKTSSQLLPGYSYGTMSFSEYLSKLSFNEYLGTFYGPVNVYKRKSKQELKTYNQ